jgi:hypothetical protein
MQVLINASKQSQDGTAVPSLLCLEAINKTCMKLTSASGKLLMMGKEDARNM